jgi:alditol oxidase
MQNWAGNVTYSTDRIVCPRSVEEAQELVAASEAIRALGTRHSFTTVADADTELLSTEHLDRIVALGDSTVTVEPGIRYGDLGTALQRSGRALANFASLPHISVGGAVATATHGSGARHQSLAGAVAALELIVADGSLRRLRRGDEDFDGAVVSLGALGVVARLTLDVVPEFEVRQYVFEELPWPVVEERIEEILAAAYSVSFFTLWTERGIDQVWVKATEAIDATSFFGARPATEPLHPVPGMPAENCTEQLGVPGPSGDRLPHFRLGFTPSGGDELQSEYIVARADAPAVVAALRALGPRLTPLLLTSEIRAIAADSLWLSPFYERDAIAFHFTWKPLPAEVIDAIGEVEAALAPFEPRPHWAKLFTMRPEHPRLGDFARLRDRLDPERTFRNRFVDNVLP